MEPFTKKCTEQHISVVQFSSVYVPFDVTVGTLHEPRGGNFFAHFTFLSVRFDCWSRGFQECPPHHLLACVWCFHHFLWLIFFFKLFPDFRRTPCPRFCCHCLYCTWMLWVRFVQLQNWTFDTLNCMFCWPCVMLQLGVNDQLDAQLRCIMRISRLLPVWPIYFFLQSKHVNW